MAHTITLIPGDYTGAEVTDVVCSLIQAAGVSIHWEERLLSSETISNDVLDSIRTNRVALMGFQHAWRARTTEPPIVHLRRSLGMFANVRPVHTFKGLPTRHDEIDLIIVREVTEDIYAHLEHESIPGVFESLKVTTRAACERIVRFGYEYAKTHGRKKVTLVHKSNIMKRSDGLFLKIGREIATEYPDITTEDVIVDALCMKLVISPSKFDVLITGNLYGDIVSDLCAGLVGGASNSPSINIGDNVQIFACPHGDPSGINDLKRGNPLGLLIPAIHLLRHIGEGQAAERLRYATEITLTNGVSPFALGGHATAKEFGDAIKRRLG